MKHLSGLDNAFLEVERGNQYMHVAGLGIYDPATAPGGKVRYKQILDFFSRRLDVAKVFRWRLVVPPFGIDRPYWIDAGEIDVEYHVRHIALPKPGDWRQLMIQVARIHSRRMDRSKPLWQAYIIEGLDNIPNIARGSFALYMKFHHASVDGEAAAQIIRAIHSYSPEPDEDDHPLCHSLVVDRDPTALEFYARAVGNRVQQLTQVGRLAGVVAGRLGTLGADAVRSGKAMEVVRGIAGQYRYPGGVSGSLSSPMPLPVRKPHTRFDARISPHRVVDAVGLPLADCKRIRTSVEGVTINDIFLAACGGALRKYLEAKHELPMQSLTALMPISTRGSNKDPDMTNQVAGVPVPLHTDIADPLERLRAVHAAARKAKETFSLLGTDLLGRLAEVMPAFLVSQFVTHVATPFFNTAVSNVRGPEVPLYMAGARMQLFLPVSTIVDGVGLNMTGFSYDNTLWVCFVSCRKMLPDPAEFRRCLTDSFNEIRDAVLAPTIRATRASNRKRRAHPSGTARAERKNPLRTAPPAGTPTAHLVERRA